jgi:hypothetical protein
MCDIESRSNWFVYGMGISRRTPIDMDQQGETSADHRGVFPSICDAIYVIEIHDLVR